jgi:hypothetical protein
MRTSESAKARDKKQAKARQEGTAGLHCMASRPYRGELGREHTGTEIVDDRQISKLHPKGREILLSVANRGDAK